MNRKVLINILIGKEEESLLKTMDQNERKELKKIFKKAKPVLDRLGTKETTTDDIKNFINVIERFLITEFINDLRFYGCPEEIIEYWKKRMKNEY